MRYRAAALLLLFAWVTLAYSSAGSTSSLLTTGPVQQRRSQTVRRRATAPPNQRPRIDYSEFSHRTQEHQQDCAECHKFPSKNWKEIRKVPEAFADITEYPEHASCLKCHSEQFFARERPAPRICSVCHVKVTPRYTERHPFPNPPENFNASKRAQDFLSDFRIQFSHDTHVALVSENHLPNTSGEGFLFVRALFPQEKQAEENDKSCAFCHQTYQPKGASTEEFVSARPKTLPEDAFWLKKGMFKTTPNHATCFTCHAPEGDMKPMANECAGCHKPLPTGQAELADFDPKLSASMGISDGNVLIKWRKRNSSGTFGHEGGMHSEQGCATCHKVSTINPLDMKTLKVPVAACDTCHIGASADEGALNFEIEKRKAEPSFRCTKCHLTFGKEPIPETHLNALPKANPK